MPECITYKDCNKQDISPEDMLRLLIRTDENGCPALAVKVQTAAGEECTPHVTCSDQGLTWQDLFFLIVTIDDNGCPMIRVIE